jgi:hypothetical protein
MQLKIKEVFTPSDNQIKAGIYGTVCIEILDSTNNLPVITVYNILVRKNKNGEMFLSMPATKNGEKYYNIVDLFKLGEDEKGNETQKSLRSNLTQEVLRILNSGGTKKPAQMSASTGSSGSNKGKNTFPWEQ